MARQTLQDDLLDTLGARIVSREYAPSHILRTEDFEAEFEVSRTVVREALKVLESMGLIGIRRAIGVTVRPASDWNVFDPRVIRWRLSGPDRTLQLLSLTELRIAVEPAAARNAAEFASEAQRAELLRLAVLLEQTGESGDLEEFLDHDIAYHRLLLESSNNEMFAALSDVVAEVLTGRTVHHLMPEHPKPEARRLHYLVARAIGERNTVIAEEAMRGVLSEVSEQMSILSKLERGDRPPAR